MPLNERDIDQANESIRQAAVMRAIFDQFAASETTYTEHLANMLAGALKMDKSDALDDIQNTTYAVEPGSESTNRWSGFDPGELWLISLALGSLEVQGFNPAYHRERCDAMREEIRIYRERMRKTS